MAFVMATSISPGAKMVLDNLAVALEVDKVVVENAIAATAQVIADANRLAEAEREGAMAGIVQTPCLSCRFPESSVANHVLRHDGWPRTLVENPLDLSQPP